MKLARALISVVAISSAALLSATPSFAETLSVDYFEISNPGYNTNSGGDFGTCCSSTPSTSENIAVGSPLGVYGLPIAGPGSTVNDLVGPDNEIAWWGSQGAPYGITPTGTGTVTLPYASDMYAPNSTGSSDDGEYETAILFGNLTDNGSPVTITVNSDDDSLVYLNGVYVGGQQGVHGAGLPTTIVLPGFNGTETIDVFYADRARTGASLSLNVTAGIPEPLTLSLFGVGLAGLAALRRRKGSLKVRHSDA